MRKNDSIDQPFRETLGLDSPEKAFIGNHAPRPVDIDQIRACYNGELSQELQDEVCKFIILYRDWHEASLQVLKDDTPGLVQEHEQQWFTNCQTLQGHSQPVTSIAWFPDGERLITASYDGTLKVWQVGNSEALFTLTGHTKKVFGVAVAPDGRFAVSAGEDNTVRLWDILHKKEECILGMHNDYVYGVTISSDGCLALSASSDKTLKVWNLHEKREVRTLRGHESEISTAIIANDNRTAISVSDDSTLMIWDLEEGSALRTLHDHTAVVTSVAMMPGGDRIISSSNDCTLRIWDWKRGLVERVVEGHGNFVDNVTVSYNGQWAASKSWDNTVRIWDCDTWKEVAVIPENSARAFPCGLAFSPTTSTLASLGDSDEGKDTAIRIWNFDEETLQSVYSLNPMKEVTSYAAAKVILLGDGGVGKTGITRKLRGLQFQTTAATHGMDVTLFHEETVGDERREIYLWDTAGQSDYRIIHQLHLNNVAVALFVFDPINDSDNYTGVRYWVQALQQSLRRSGKEHVTVRKYLVAGRIDTIPNGNNPKIQELHMRRMKQLQKELHLDGCFITSGKEGWGIAQLADAIRHDIAWNELSIVMSSRLFERTKSFIAQTLQRKGAEVLVSETTLYENICNTAKSAEILQEKFEGYLARIQSTGMIHRFKCSSQAFVLLQPDLMDTYASALFYAAKFLSEGTGWLPLEGNFADGLLMLEDKRVRNREQEQLLLHSVIQELLRHDLAFIRVQDRQQQLVFPNAMTAKCSELAQWRRTRVFRFSGAAGLIYSKLVVRLTRSGLFQLQDIWRNAVTYTVTGTEGSTCAMYFEDAHDGNGTLTICFNTEVNDTDQETFRYFIEEQLELESAGKTIDQEEIVRCAGCGLELSAAQITMRRRQGEESIICGGCETFTNIRDERKTDNMRKKIDRMNQTGKKQRNKDMRISTGHFVATRPSLN